MTATENKLGLADWHTLASGSLGYATTFRGALNQLEARLTKTATQTATQSLAIAPQWRGQIILRESDNQVFFGAATGTATDASWRKVLYATSAFSGGKLGANLDLNGFGLIVPGATGVITDVLDEDDLSSDSNTAVPTQQSVKAYVDGKTHGKVLQVAQTVDVVNHGTTSITFTDSGVSAVLGNNLASTSSKVLIRVSGIIGNPTGSVVASLTLHDGTSELTPTGVNAFWQGFAGIGSNCPFSFEFLHSPASVTPKTYTLYYKTASGTLYLGRRGDDTILDVPTIMTLEEIAA